MRVLVTRPVADAQGWVAGLQGAGFEALSLPLIEIGPVADLAPTVSAWRQLGSYNALMFVSGNAVAGFFAARPQGVENSFQNGGQLPHAPRAWATGPGTHKALIEAGVSEHFIDAPSVDSAQFDSEALWARVSTTVGPGMKVLLVRGATEHEAGNSQPKGLLDFDSRQGAGRDWLATRLGEQGVAVEWVAVYQRQLPQFSLQQEASIRASSHDASVWLFSSSEAVENLTNQFADLQWSTARAVATHPRIAQTARKAGFGVVYESRPTLEAVVASIESMR